MSLQLFIIGVVHCCRQGAHSVGELVVVVLIEIIQVLRRIVIVHRATSSPCVVLLAQVASPATTSIRLVKVRLSILSLGFVS